MSLRMYRVCYGLDDDRHRTLQEVGEVLGVTRDTPLVAYPTHSSVKLCTLTLTIARRYYRIDGEGSGTGSGYRGRC